MKKITFIIAFLISFYGISQTTISAPETNDVDSILVLSPQKKAAHVRYTTLLSKLSNDLAISSGSVFSVFGRAGVVTSQIGDYTADQINESATRVFLDPSQKALITTALQPASLSPYLTSAIAYTTYKPIGYTPSWSEITSKPTTINDYGITDFNILGDDRWSLLSHTHDLSAITQSSATTGQVPTWNGTVWIPETPSGGGHEIQLNGVTLATQPKLNFKGTGVTVENNAGNESSDVTINSVNTASNIQTYETPKSITFDALQPNYYTTLTGNIDVTLTGTENGSSGKYTFYNTQGKTITLNGFKGLVIPSNNEEEYVFYEHDNEGLKWYFDKVENLNEITGTNINWLTSSFQKITLTDDETITITNPSIPSNLTLEVAGSYDITFPSNVIGVTSPYTQTTDLTLFDMVWDGTYYLIKNINLYTLPEVYTLATGTTIQDPDTSTSADVLFNGILTDNWNSQRGNLGYAGLDLGISESISKIRIYAIEYIGQGNLMNGAQIQYSSIGDADESNWTTVHTVSGASLDTWYEQTFTPVSARYWRVYTPYAGSYGGRLTEVEFLKLN